MLDRVVPRSLMLLVLSASGLLAVWMFMQGDAPLISVLVAAVTIALAAAVVSPVASGNQMDLSIAAAAALPFVFASEIGVDLYSVIGSYMMGGLLLTLFEMLRGKTLERAGHHTLRRVLGFSVFAGVFAGARQLVGTTLGDSGWEILVPFILGTGAWLVVELASWALLASDRKRISVRYLALSGLKDTNVFVSIVATGGLFGLMYGALGWWALAVALLPYSFAHGAFRRLQETKATYKQTIRALAQIPEAAGLNLRGHADRTAELSVAMAKDLGLNPIDVEDVEFAALMHDIGRVTLNEPSVVEQGWTDEDLARWGSEIIAGAPSLDRVAGYVRRQYEPFRKPGEESDPSVSTVARIVKIASAYDAQHVGQAQTRLEALEYLHQGAAYEYDPEVVAALRRVLELGSGRPVNA